ncbi:hypothetical protein NDU88_004306 [Pleurodeles waltl]|uniref:Uncharacterized protein n=1 Tax=Pleurodeles waltl TaxID=8319 RepID=A0AAV7T7F3_PLEWA|nr:hypothetical protein NDU88_004306 [Pleurodeles waltl]
MSPIRFLFMPPNSKTIFYRWKVYLYGPCRRTLRITVHYITIISKLWKVPNSVELRARAGGVGGSVVRAKIVLGVEAMRLKIGTMHVPLQTGKQP